MSKIITLEEKPKETNITEDVGKETKIEYCPECGKPKYSKMDLKKQEFKTKLKETIKKDPLKFIVYSIVALVLIQAFLF